MEPPWWSAAFGAKPKVDVLHFHATDERRLTRPAYRRRDDGLVAVLDELRASREVIHRINAPARRRGLHSRIPGRAAAARGGPS